MSVSTATFILGNLEGYATKALPQLQNDTNTNIRMDEYTGSWFASLFWITGIFACPFGGWLGDYIGRRKIVLLANPIIIAGLAILGSAQTKTTLFFGPILAKMCTELQSPNIGNSEKYCYRIPRIP